MVVPADWKELEISELCVPQKSRIDPRVSGGGDICVELEHIAGGSGQLLGVTKTSGTSSLKTKFESGDVLFGKLRAYLRKYWLAEFAGVCSTEIWALSANRTRVVPGFLAQIVRTEDFIEAASVSYGTHMPRSDWSIVSKLIVSVPLLKEQEAIAQALSDADRAIESLDALIAKKRDVKQATMQQLLTGRTRLPGFTADWKEVRLGDIALVVMGQSPQSIYYNTREVGIPLIQGNADIIDRKSIRRIWTSVSPKVAEPGDVLITVRAPVGYAAIASEQVCLGRGVCAIQPHDADSAFVFHSLVYWEPKWKKMEQGSTFTAANSKDVNDFTIHVPDSTKEQEAVAEVLSVMDDELEALTEQVFKLRMVKEGMMQDLLTGKVRLV